MHFKIKRADEEDLHLIMDIMTECRNAVENKEWFVADDEAYVKEHLSGKGFAVLARTDAEKAAGFFLVKYLDQEDELTCALGYDKKKTEQTAVMDSACVKVEYRGYSLQRKMQEEAEKMLDKNKYHFLICTVHPDNLASLKSMQKNGFHIRKKKKCYGGYVRYILEKEL